MRSARDLSLTIALCASIIAHGLLAYATFEISTRQLADIRLPGYPRAAQDDFIEVDQPNSPRLGTMDNSGLAPNASDGKESLRAREAPNDQALLSRDPQGPGRIGDLPSMSLVPQEDGPTVEGSAAALGAVALVHVLPDATEEPQPFGSGASIPPAPTPKPRMVVVAPAPPEEAGPIARSNKPAADPAPMSDSESDAFSTLGGIEFRDGKMESRLGRAFKSVRPRLSLAAQLDLLSISQPRMVLKIGIDAKGNVTAVDVMRSTGSNQVDQPVKVAMYQWWFEPAKGPNGRPVPETIVFPISWH
ncbi:MAG: TonB family protein [Tepidisphaeraceae bacterium]